MFSGRLNLINAHAKPHSIMSHTPYYPTGGVPRFDMGASPVPSTPGLARPLPSSIRQTRGVRPPKPASPPPGAKSPPQQLKSGARPKKKSGKITGVTVTIGGKRVDDEEGRAPHEEAQFILRFPDDIPGLEKFRKAVDDGNPPEDFRIRFHSDRWATVTLDGQDYRAMLKDLPTVNESWKSFDRVQWWKIADVHQMLVVEGPEPPRAAEMAEPTKEEYTMNDGLTPPLKNVTNRRFRKAQLKQVCVLDL